MPGSLNPEERRAYREGVVDQKLDDHDGHFLDINGSLHKLADALMEVEKTVSRLVDQVQGVAIVMPSIQKLASDTATSTETAALVAEALKKKTDEGRTRWDRWRTIVAWGLGVVIAGVTIANFATRTLGVPDKTSPAVTVTVPDITPGGP